MKLPYPKYKRVYFLFQFQTVLFKGSATMCGELCYEVGTKIKHFLPSFLFLMVRAFTHGAMCHRIDPSWVDPLSYFSFQPMLHDWCNKGRYPVCGMMHIKEPLLLIGKSSPCGGSGFHLSLSEWSFTICLTPYNHK